MSNPDPAEEARKSQITSNGKDAQQEKAVCFFLDS